MSLPPPSTRLTVAEQALIDDYLSKKSVTVCPPFTYAASAPQSWREQADARAANAKKSPTRYEKCQIGARATKEAARKRGDEVIAALRAGKTLEDIGSETGRTADAIMKCLRVSHNFLVKDVRDIIAGHANDDL